MTATGDWGLQGMRALVAAMLAVAAAHAAAADPASCPAPGAPVAQPYRWFPALDLARIPFHMAEGPWGPRATVVAPEPPVTNRIVKVTSAAQLVSEARVPGSQIVVEASYIGHVMIAGDVQDVDIVVPEGKRIAHLVVGRYSPPSVTRRVRIRGATPGQHSGGTIGGLVFHSAQTSDVIIDGVDLNGEDGKGGNLLWHFSRGADRVAIVNVRGHGVGPGSIQRGSSIVIAGSHFVTGARAREANGYPEGWGVRGGDRLIVYGNRIEGNRYHRLRLHPEPGTEQYAWVANNTLVDAHEARILSVFNANARNTYRFGGLWAVCNEVYLHSKCMPPSFDGQAADYAMLTSNAFYGTLTQAFHQMQQGQHGPGRDYLTGNTYSPWKSPPPWPANANPAEVPLPTEQPSRYAAAQQQRPCPGP
jgi:hypothetical protein